MKMLKPVKGDVLNDPVILRNTKEILAFQTELENVANRAAQELGTIIANIGDRLIAVKKALDNTTDKTAWVRWLKKHIRYTRQTATNYMRVARMRKILENAFSKFLEIKMRCLYSISSLPDKLLKKLTPDTLLWDPDTEKEKPLKDMNKEELDRALGYLQYNKYEPRTPESIKKRLKAIRNEVGKIKADPDLVMEDWLQFQDDIFTQSSDGNKSAPAIQGVTWDQVGKSLLAHLEWLAKIIKALKGSGKLKGTLKKALLDKYETVRIALLKLPAYARHGGLKRVKPAWERSE